MLMITKKKNMARACLLAIISALLPLTASAVDMPGFYLGVGMSYINSDDKRSNDDDIAPVISVGRMLGESYSLDLEYNNYNFDINPTGSADISGFNLTGRFYFLGNDKSSPYVGVGIGSLESDTPFSQGSDTHFDVAAGMHWLIGERWGLRGEVRQRFAGDNSGRSSVDDLEDWMIGVGLTYSLSSRVKHMPAAKSNQRPASDRLAVDRAESKTTFILLSDEDGSVGQIVVNTEGGQQEISQAGYAIDVSSAELAPAEPEKIEQTKLDTVFEAAQAVFPETPKHYQLHFEYDSTELTADSKRLIPEVIAAIKAHNSVEIGVVGHSDTYGKKDYNLTLSERRAEAITRVLVEMGVRKDRILSASDGENNPLVPTADQVKEGKNRRVEITIR